MRTRPADELGIDTFYYSIKATAREACAPIQAQIVTKGEARTEKGVKIYALSDYGWGKAGGCLGIHCGHYLTPFVVGVNDLPELPDHLKNLTPEQAEENARIEAKQRALERAIRDQKERLHISKQLGDEELITMERLKLRNLQGKVRNLVDSHSFLHRDYAREKLYNGATEKTRASVNRYANTLKIQRRIKSDIINLRTKDDVVISDISKHLIERMTKREVLQHQIEDALTNPLEIKPDRIDEKGVSRRYIGREAVVNINPKTGNIVTTWKTGSKLRSKYED